MMEVALVFDKDGKTICFHEPMGRTGGAIPDSRNLWDILWENRERLGGVAHTHPWDGDAWYSHTDVTTFRAIEMGIGRDLMWPIATFTDIKTFVFMSYDEEHQGYGSLATCDAEAMGFPRKFILEGLTELRAKSR